MRILVAYASRTGVTAEIAEEIGWTLSKAGEDVTVHRASEIERVDGFQAVIVGSAIRGDQWLPEATDFVREQQQALSCLPVAYFAVGRSLREDLPSNRRRMDAVLDPARKLVAPIDVGLFAGALQYERFSWIMRLLMRLSRTPEGDYRDWDAIRAWALQVRSRLNAQAPGAKNAET